jgi:hypothetical protein
MASPYSRFTWRETEPGIWTRDVDEVEQFYSAIAKRYESTGRMFFGITGHVALKINVPVNSSSDTVGQKFDSALRSAWASLRHDHPTIASQVKFDDKDDTWVKEYHHDSGNWMENTLKWIDKGKTGVEWANSDPPAPLLPTIFVVVPPARKSGEE